MTRWQIFKYKLGLSVGLLAGWTFGRTCMILGIDPWVER